MTDRRRRDGPQANRDPHAGSAYVTPSPRDNPLLDSFWLAGDGIERQVLQAKVQRFLGPEARCRPMVFKGKQGFEVTAIGQFTPHMVDTLKFESQRYWNEMRARQREGRQAPSYVDSDTMRNSHPGYDINEWNRQRSDRPSGSYVRGYEAESSSSQHGAPTSYGPSATGGMQLPYSTNQGVPGYNSLNTPFLAPVTASSGQARYMPGPGSHTVAPSAPSQPGYQNFQDPNDTSKYQYDPNGGKAGPQQRPNKEPRNPPSNRR